MVTLSAVTREKKLRSNKPFQSESGTSDEILLMGSAVPAFRIRASTPSSSFRATFKFLVNSASFVLDTQVTTESYGEQEETDMSPSKIDS